MERVKKLLSNCNLCPYNCGANRILGEVGVCKANDKLKIALSSLHYYEEPCISGINGSGTVFFSNCNLSCVYCQNYEISQLNKGKEISVDNLAEIFLQLQQKNAHNINLVSPTIYVPLIIHAIKIAKSKGLKLPIIYNTSGYEKIETLKMLEGYIDVYLPDLKYSDEMLALKYSKAPKYFEIATKAIREMYRQVGRPILNNNGIIEKGLIIRHLVLPNQIDNSKKVLKWIEQNVNPSVFVSVMAQYFPCYKAKECDELNRKLTKEEYKNIEEYLYSLNLENGYIQELGEHEEEYVPKFDI